MLLGRTALRLMLPLVACALVASSSLAASNNSKDMNDFLRAMGNSGSDGVEVNVEVNKGTPIRLDAPAASVAVANPDIADVQVVSPRMLFVNGRSVGETSIIAVDNQDHIVFEGSVNVSHNLSRLKRAVAEMDPDAKIDAESTDNAIILRGKVDSPVMADKVQKLATTFLRDEKQSVINMLDTSDGDQVMLKVKIVEVARSELKRFGINWESVLNSGDFIFGLANGRDFVDAAGSFTRDIQNDSSLGIGYHGGNDNINAMIDALETNGLISVLAEPNLTTRSGMPANFLAGGEFPIPVPGENGTVTIEYRQFGVSLQFTPIVMSKNKISLTVVPEVSALSDENSTTGPYGTIRALTTRRASTTVDLGSGQTFAIAGLLRNDDNSSVSKFPGLGDIPLVGALFRTTESRNNQTELVILVTPFIVKGVNDPSKMATPLDGYKPATDGERILLGRLHGESLPGTPDAAKVAERPTGTPPDAVVATTTTDVAAPVAPVDSSTPVIAGSAPAATPAPAPAVAGAPPVSLGGQAGFLMR